MKLNEKQQAKVSAVVATLDLTESGAAVKAAQADSNLGNLKAARRALVKQLHIIDKALVVYDVDVALDEAKALVTKAKAKA